MTNLIDILNEGVFNTTVDDVTVLSQIEGLKKYNAVLYDNLHRKSNIAKGYDALGNKLKQGDWCLIPPLSGWKWQIALMVVVNGKLVQAVVDPIDALTDPDGVKVRYSNRETRDCFKIDNIVKFMKFVKLGK